MATVDERIQRDMQVFVTRGPQYGMTTGEAMADGFFVREGWGTTGTQPKEGDYLVPLAAISTIGKKIGVWHIYLSLTREEVQRCSTRWMVANGFVPRAPLADKSGADNARANLDRLLRAIGRGSKEETPAHQVPDDPFFQPPNPQDAADLGERAIIEIRQIRERADAFKEQYGPFSADEEAIHTQAMEKRVAQVRQRYERELATLTGE